MNKMKNLAKSAFAAVGFLGATVFVPFAAAAGFGASEHLVFGANELGVAKGIVVGYAIGLAAGLYTVSKTKILDYVMR